MGRRHTTFLFFMCSLLLVGCGTAKRNFTQANPQLVASPDSVSAMLADAADRASTALQTLAAVEHERTNTVVLAPVSDAPLELRRAVTVNWIGPVETITATLADRASYNFSTLGNPPPIPLIISIDAQNRPVIDVLRDVGLQLGARADIKVDSNSRVVEIHYPPTPGRGGIL